MKFLRNFFVAALVVATENKHFTHFFGHCIHCFLNFLLQILTLNLNRGRPLLIRR